MRSPRQNLLAPLAVLGSIVSLCVGSSYAKSLFPVLGAPGLTAYRVGFAALMLVAFWRPWRVAITKKEAILIFAYGVILGLMNLSFYMAIRTLPMGIAIAIEFTGPLALAILSSRRAIDFLWIACAAIGLVLLLPIHHETKPLDPVGLCFISAAAIFWALYIIFGQKAGTAHAGQVTSLGMLTAAFVVVPFGVAHAGAALFVPHLIVLGLAVAFLSSAIPYSLEMFALKRLPKQTFGILLSTEPAVGAISGWLILGETLTTLQMLAIACIIAASIGSTATIKREDTPQIAQADPVVP